MPFVEEQTQHNTDILIYTGLRIRIGEKLTISDFDVTKLAFLLRRAGNPAGNVTFAIRKVSDDSILGSKVWGDAGSLLLVDTWEEVTFDSPVYVNEEVRISCEFGGGDASNHVVFRYQNSDVYAGGIMCLYPLDSWNDQATLDAAFKYTYQGAAPSVTSQDCSEIMRYQAKGHGTLVDIGGGAVTSHGHCWSTLPDPTIADPHTDLGAKTPGTFESTITGLAGSNLYYVRAYAINSEGTGYGNQVSFISGDTEDQILNNGDMPLYGGGPRTRAGQKMKISRRRITKLAFIMRKENTPTGNVIFTIRRVSDDSILASKVWGDAATLPLVDTWEEVTFDSPVFVNEEVRLLYEWAPTETTNYVHGRRQETDVKAGECLSHYMLEVWYDIEEYDMAYRYYYLTSQGGLGSVKGFDFRGYGFIP